MNRKSALLALLTILVLTVSLLRPSVARAEGENPPDPAATETFNGTDETAPVTEEPAAATDESVTVPEILEQAPEGTEIMVVNAVGEPEPLATVAAAEIIANSDPVWCPVGETPATDTDPVTPGNQNSCTSNQPSVTDLLNLLQDTDPDGDPDTPAPYAGNGTIFFQDGVYGGTETSLVFDSDVLASLGDLTLWGGWDLVNYVDLNGTTIFTVPVDISWVGDVSLYNLAIDLETSTFTEETTALTVDTTGIVDLENVTVENNANGDGAVITTDGDVSLTDSGFNNNDGDGLVVVTTGSVDLTGVDASENTLTGAYLDSCEYGFTEPGLCDGTGTVTVTDSTFDENGIIGLNIDSGGDVVLLGTDANDNGLYGVNITSADEDGTGNVSITDGTFGYAVLDGDGNVIEDHGNGTGLNVFTGGSITLAEVYAEYNNLGAILNSTYGATGGSITIEDSRFNGNDWTGLHAEADGAIFLDGVSASDNGSNGAYLISADDVTVIESVFNGNVNFASPADPGLYVESYGNITLTDVQANGNLFGAGAVLVSQDAGNILVQQSVFNSNGTFGIQASSHGGDITLNGSIASYNAIKGAYLNADTNGALIGNIFIYNSTFVENGVYGIYATADEGNITLDLVTVIGSDGAPGPGDDNPTNIGAFLVASGGGNIFVSDSLFQLNSDNGLLVVGSNEVTLTDMVANANGGNGVAVYSTYTYGCRCPDEVPVNITVNVDGGSFTNNGEYGLYVMPGPDGELVFVDPPTTAPSVFADNVAGDTLLNNDDPEICTDPCACQPCGCDDEGENNDGGTKLMPQIIGVPFKGGEPVLQDCINFSGTILQLPDGSWVKFGCPFTGYTIIEGLNKEDLPGELGAGITFLAGIDARMFEADGVTPVLVNPNGSLVLSFNLPEDQRIRSYSVLYWDPTANDGEGTWIAMPPYEVGTQFPLYPDNPEDQRLILSGVQEVDGMVTFTVNFPGIFVLVTP